MNKFTTIADDFLNVFGLHNINDNLNKFVHKKGYNKNEHQRLVEEVNISIFLKKLDNNTSYEDYELAEPVIINLIEPVIINNGLSLKKVANHQVSTFKITPDMFDLQSEDVLTSSGINTIAYGGIKDDNLSKIASEEKEIEKEIETNDLLIKMAQEKSINLAGNEVDRLIKKLTKIANNSPEDAKSIVYTLSKHELKKYAEEVLIECKHNRKDLIKANNIELTKEAGHIMNGLASIGKGVWNVGSGATKIGYGLVGHMKRHPIVSLGVAGLGYGAYKNPDRVENLRQAVSMNNYIEGN